MKVLICYNKDKDKSKYCIEFFSKFFAEKGIEFYIIEKNDEEPNEKYDALFVIGGDGTILRRTKYANLYNVPIIGINTGKLGFLAEFKSEELEELCNMFLNGELIKDERLTICADYKDKKYYALNDVVVQRVYRESKSMIINIDVIIGNHKAEKIVGDGVILCSPTGSTAYSLSLGGAVLAPDVNAFSFTPIAPHSFGIRPMIYSPETTSKIIYNGGNGAGFFVDGKLCAILDKGDEISINKCENKTVFLRKPTYDFYKRLTDRLRVREE